MKVTLIARTQLEHPPQHPVPESYLSEWAAKICRRGQFYSDQVTEDFIVRVIKLGHESVLEHINVTFLIEGISRVCSHQLVRHRLCSYSQMSERTVDVDQMEFIRPESIAEEDWRRHVSQCIMMYNRLRHEGVRKEDARFVLPQGTGTVIMMTANLRQWRHVIKERMTKEAQWEIRRVAEEVYRQLKEIYPDVFADISHG